MILYSTVGTDFDFKTAVGSHGFFALAPNAWDPSSPRLCTTVGAGGIPLSLELTPASSRGRDAVRIRVDGMKTLTPEQRRAVRSAVGRILRLDEDLSGFHELCRSHPELQAAGSRRFGRMLRSATLFEDIVKTLCTCNITWRQTLAIVRRLVAEYGPPAVNDPAVQGFPTPDRLARLDSQDLRTATGAGYRSDWIVGLARGLDSGHLDLGELENPALPADEVYRRLREIRGVGDYAASVLCMLLGHYDRLAVDTELIRHFRERYPRRKATPTLVREHYARFRPYQYLAYWWELWNRYLDETGQPTSWCER